MNLDIFEIKQFFQQNINKQQNAFILSKGFGKYRLSTLLKQNGHYKTASQLLIEKPVWCNDNMNVVEYTAEGKLTIQYKNLYKDETIKSFFSEYKTESTTCIQLDNNKNRYTLHNFEFCKGRRKEIKYYDVDDINIDFEFDKIHYYYKRNRACVTLTKTIDNPRPRRLLMVLAQKDENSLLYKRYLPHDILMILLNF
jgi:hypothetical protein